MCQLLPGAMEYAERGIVTGGAARNRQYLAGKVHIERGHRRGDGARVVRSADVGRAAARCPSERGAEVEAQFAAAGETVWRVGEVVEGEGVEVVA